MKKSILGLSLMAVLIFAGCSKEDDEKVIEDVAVNQNGVDIAINDFGGVGTPLRSKVALNKGQVLELNLKTENLGNLDAKDVRVECIMRSEDDANTLAFEEKLTDLLKVSELHKKNLYIDGVAALEPGKYILNCEVATASKDLSKSNNSKSVEVIIQ